MTKAVYHRATTTETLLTVLLQLMILFHFSSIPTRRTSRVLVVDAQLLSKLQRFNFIQPRIVGGNDVTNANKYPYFVEWDEAGCGATLIHEDLILTAAHCYWKKALGSKVYIGSLRSQDNKGNRAFVREIINMTQHPDYDDWTWYADYMIAKLNAPIDSTIIKPVQLNRDYNYPPNNELLTVIGFGDLWDGHEKGSDILQETTVNHVPFIDCYEQYDRTNEGEVNDTLMICAGTNNGRDTCFGDSGGPLLNLNGTIQIGITSWGVSCADEWPAVYSRVSGAIDWIDYQICQQATNPPLSCFETEEEEEGEEEVVDNSTLTTAINSGTDTTTTTTTAVDNSDNSDNSAAGDDIDSSTSSSSATTTATATEPHSSSSTQELPPNNSNNNSMSNGNVVQLQIDILYDERPMETAWALIYNNIAIQWSFFNEVTEPSKLVTTTIQDAEPGNYYFVIMDNANNGICCDYGEGYVKIMDVTNNIIIFESSGDFYGSEAAPFELPYHYTNNPSSSVSSSRTNQP